MSSSSSLPPIPTSYEQTSSHLGGTKQKNKKGKKRSPYTHFAKFAKNRKRQRQENGGSDRMIRIQPGFTFSKERIQEQHEQEEEEEEVPSTKSGGGWKKKSKWNTGFSSFIKEEKWYGVANGREVGVYKTWDECSKHVVGFSKAKYKSFPSEKEAIEWLDNNGIRIARDGEVFESLLAGTTTVTKILDQERITKQSITTPKDQTKRKDTSNNPNSPSTRSISGSNTDRIIVHSTTNESDEEEEEEEDETKLLLV
jgi:viroplasmin and RNaseH domain-containing protein